MTGTLKIGTRVQHTVNKAHTGTIVALTEDSFGNIRYVVDLDNGSRNVIYGACMMEREESAVAR